MVNNLSKITKNPLIIVIMVGMLHAWLFWPGMLSPDSQTQYSIAISGVYSDHHPALMSFVWRYLDKIYPGPGMMLLLHLSLLYGAVFYLIRSLPTFRYRFLFILLPFLPPILIYSEMIWKDIGFAFSFLFVASYLAYLTSIKQKPTWHQILILLIILLYGTAVKFQAQYCAPVLLGWIAYSFLNYKLDYKKFIPFLLILAAGFYFSLHSINNALVPNAQKNHSWQLVKLYDLAAISHDTNTVLFPEFTQKSNFSVQELEKRFNHQRVDDLIFDDDAILRQGITAEEREILYSTWLKAVCHHPFIYLKHRAMNMAHIMLSAPGFSHVTPALTKLYPPESTPYKILYYTARIMAFLIMAHFIPIVFGFVYFGYGILTLRSSWAAIPLIGFNGVGIMMTSVLFFCSMAGAPRYTYVCVCMWHASHVFVYLCFKARRARINAQ